MSGPLSSSEIEDVVSSVRRLVSADARPRPMSRDLGQDRLILTPALRVMADLPVSEVPAREVGDAKAQADDPLVLSARLPEVAADAAEPAPALVEADWEDRIWQEEAAPLAELALGAEEAELLPADETGAEDATGDATDPDRDAPPPESGDEAAWGHADDAFEEDEPPTVVPLLRPVPPACELEPEAVAAAAPDAGASAAFAETPAAAEIARPDPAPRPPEPEPLMAAGLGGEAQTLVDKDGNPLTVLDEDALHEIVRSMIREEFQGVLGERITRNVRKLVRAEINRALTVRALD